MLLVSIARSEARAGFCAASRCIQQTFTTPLQCAALIGRKSHCVRLVQPVTTWTCSSGLSNRTFSTTTILRKGKKGKQRDEGEDSVQDNKNKKTSTSSDPQAISEALSLTTLKTEVRRIHDKLKQSLGSLKPGGRFDPQLIEALRVDISKLQPQDPQNSAGGRHTKETEKAYIKNDASTHEVADNAKKGKGKNKNVSAPTKQSSQTVPLTDLAQVIPRGGKSVVIMLNEEEFAKPVTSTLLASPYSLNPQPSATNPLEMTVPIPPPSAETRKQTIGQVDKFQERAESDLSKGRGDMQKTFRALSLDGRLRPDDHHKGQKDMEKAVEEARTEIKRLCDTTRKALQQG